jgi:putative drug exporter of the RND superfamily
VAIVSAGDVHSFTVRQRVEQVADQLRAEPDVASAVSFYETRDHAMVSRDGRSTYVVAYFKARSDNQLEDAAQRPIFLAAVAFGLATDYGVFLLSRIKEAHDRGISDSEAVAVGLERTGRIVTAAAILFAVAIGAFATSKLVFIKELGLGAALAVLIDASIIRALLVPSLMELLGSWNWWAPRPLRRLHDRIGLHESGPATARPRRPSPPLPRPPRAADPIAKPQETTP